MLDYIQNVEARLRVASLVFSALLLLGCGTPPPSYEDGLPPLMDHLACQPSEAATIVAHRGTVDGWNEPENSISALQKLINKNYLMAEIDVAQTQDGVLFTFHDGVWEDISTGQGSVAASTSEDLDKILLRRRTTNQVTDQRPAKFDDMLALAKGKIYLEIDFKSSAKFEDVIAAIRAADMADQVVLIAYSAGQAKTLARLAPEMALSVPPESAAPDRLVWMGWEITDAKYDKLLKKMGIVGIGRVNAPSKTRNLNAYKSRAHILVTDDANLYLPMTGLTADGRTAYVECLSER